MKVFKEKIDFLAWRNSLDEEFSLVPTMGNLHAGHLNLVEQALGLSQHCIVSIFVNPLQFGAGEDFGKYPKTLEDDLKKLEEVEKKSGKRITVFAPQSSLEIFPQDSKTLIEVKGLDRTLCGKFRPGHFIGVTTVVFHLFRLTRPVLAIFGQKDFQQYLIVEKMTQDLDLPVKLVMAPTLRNESGLALSSRNQYLSDSDKTEALKLSLVINKTCQSFKALGIQKAQDYIKTVLEQDSRFQYLEILDASSLLRPTGESKKLVVAGAFILGDTRLIDNCLIS
jgi:pantoate--beta-alanine ligase